MTTVDTGAVQRADTGEMDNSLKFKNTLMHLLEGIRSMYDTDPESGPSQIDAIMGPAISSLSQMNTDNWKRVATIFGHATKDHLGDLEDLSKGIGDEGALDINVSDSLGTVLQISTLLGGGIDTSKVTHTMAVMDGVIQQIKNDEESRLALFGALHEMATCAQGCGSIEDDPMLSGAYSMATKLLTGGSVDEEEIDISAIRGRTRRAGGNKKSRRNNPK